MIETQRLRLRPWRDDDRAPLAVIHADPEVMDWLGVGPLSAAESAAFLDRVQEAFARRGHGLLALERKADQRLIGFAGLNPIDHPPPVPQGVEFTWVLARFAWGEGYATEAARALLADGLERLRLPEILAYTSRSNQRSQAVMQRIGLARRPDLDFDHPVLSPEHPLRPHVVFSTRTAGEARIAREGSMV